MNIACKVESSTDVPGIKPELNKAYLGDCVETMNGWPDSFVDCAVTSVPYFALRSYLPDGHKAKDLEMGAQQTLGEYLLGMGKVFAEVRRITKPSGTLWVNIGDTWCNSKNKKFCPSDYRVGEALDVPHKLSDEIRAAGWRKTSEVIWHKPNPNPRESGRHPFPSHEYVFQFTKTDDNYYDHLEIQEVADYQPDESRLLYRHAQSVWKIPIGGLKGRKLMADLRHEGVWRERDGACPWHGDNPTELDGMPLFSIRAQNGTKTLIEKTTCTCKPVDADFFAVMPLALAERCIKVSTSNVGNCSVCGDPVSRIVNRERMPTRSGEDVKVDPAGKTLKDPRRHVSYRTHGGWLAGCGHHEATRVLPIVFDPFLGSGTTAVAASLLGRDWLGCELNPMCVDRLIPARLKASNK